MQFFFNITHQNSKSYITALSICSQYRSAIATQSDLKLFSISVIYLTLKSKPGSLYTYILRGTEHHWFLVPGVPSTTGSLSLGYRVPLVPCFWVPSTTGSWFLVPSTTGFWIPGVPSTTGSWGTEHHWLLISGVPSTTGYLFLGYLVPLVPGSWGTEYHWFLVPGVPITTGSWFLGYRAPLVPGSWGTEYHWFLVPGY